MKILQDFSLTELKRELETIIEKMPRYRAEQVYKWANDYATFDEMNNIPKDLRETLKESFNENPVKIEKELISKDGTKKYLLSLPDGNIVECVLMSYKYGNTICISTQVGCRMGWSPIKTSLTLIREGTLLAGSGCIHSLGLLSLDHKPSGLHKSSVLPQVLGGRSLRSRCRRGHAPSEGAGEGSGPGFSCSFWSFHR